MYKYIGKRILQMFIALFLISVFAFALLHMIPGDPVYAMLGDEISIERHDQVYSEMGLDKPLIQQYGDWITNFIQGDMGYSFSYRKDVSELVSARLPTTMYLGVISSLFSVVIGVLFGTLTAVKRGTWIDNVVTVVSNIGLATPVFWFGILLVRQDDAGTGSFCSGARLCGLQQDYWKQRPEDYAAPRVSQLPFPHYRAHVSKHWGNHPLRGVSQLFGSGYHASYGVLGKDGERGVPIPYHLSAVRPASRCCRDLAGLVV